MDEIEKNQVEAEITAFINASEYKAKEERKSIMNRMKEIVGQIIVRCPECSAVQKTESYETKKCIKCGTQFVIFPEHEPSRIFDCAFNREKRAKIIMLQRNLHGRNTLGL